MMHTRSGRFLSAGGRRHSPVSAVPAALVAGCLLLTACSSGGSAGAEGSAGSVPDQVSVLLDWSPNPDHVALFTADHTGAYDEQGLTVDFMTPANTADAAREVSLGRVDLAVSYEPDTLIAVGQGLEVVSVAALIPTSLASLIAREDAGITSAADLEGKTVGLSGLASQRPTIDFIARQAGIDPDSITTPNVQQSLNQALLTDQVDAIFGGYRNIEGIELAAREDVVVLPATELGVPDYAELVIIANPDRLARDGDYAERVRGFLAAVAAGQQAALRDRQTALDALAGETAGAFDADVLEDMVSATLELLPAEGFGRQSAAEWSAYARWMHENGLLDSEVAGADATTNDYLSHS